MRPAKDTLTISPVISRNVLNQFEHLPGFEDGRGRVWGEAGPWGGGCGEEGEGREQTQWPSPKRPLSDPLQDAPHPCHHPNLPRPPLAGFYHLFLFSIHFSFQRAGLQLSMERAGTVERPGCCVCRQEAWFSLDVRRCPGVFMQRPVQAWPAGVDFNSPLPNCTFKRCQISKTFSPSQSKHLGEEGSSRS